MNPVAPVTKIRIFSSYAAANSVVRDEALTRFASHKEALAVRARLSGDEAGRSSVVSNSRNHACAESSTSSDPNNSHYGSEGGRQLSFRIAHRLGAIQISRLSRDCELIHHLPVLLSSVDEIPKFS